MKDEDIIKELESKKAQLTVQLQNTQSVYQSNIAKIDSAILVLQGKGDSDKPEGDSAKLREMILFAINVAPQHFSINDIEKIMAIHFPDAPYKKSSVASLFWKIATENFTMISPGMGRSPTFYSKVK